MSCVPSCVPSSDMLGRVTKEDFDRWTDNVHHVLNSPRARRKFGEFLETRKFEEAENTLRFWERCNRFLVDVEQDKSLHRRGKTNTASVSRFRKEAVGIVDMAENGVNFDFAQVQSLRDSLQTVSGASSSNLTKLAQKIREAKNATAVMLIDEYDLFRTRLLEEKGLIKK